MFGTDSHTCNAGAFGQFASGIGNTDAGFILGTGKLLIKVPPTLRFVLDGQMPPYLMAKDLILHIIGEITTAGLTHPHLPVVPCFELVRALQNFQDACCRVHEQSAESACTCSCLIYRQILSLRI